MTMFLAPYTAIADIDGSPLDAGFLFFGEYNKDPELFPVPVYWDADFTVPAAQPIRTRNGYPVRNGSPTKVYLKTAQHSIVIKNRNSAFILVDFKNKGWDSSFIVHKGRTQYEINEYQGVFNQGLESVHELLNITNPKHNQRLFVKSYHEGLGRGGNEFYYDPSRASEYKNGVCFNGWVAKEPLKWTPDHFGAKPNDPDYNNYQAFRDCDDHTRSWHIPSGRYKFKTDFQINPKTKITSEGDLSILEFENSQFKWNDCNFLELDNFIIERTGIAVGYAVEAKGISLGFRRIYLNGTKIMKSTGGGLVTSGAWIMTWINPYIHETGGYGLLAEKGGWETGINNLTLIGGEIYHNTHGLALDCFKQLQILGTAIEGNYDLGIAIGSKAGEMSILGYFEANQKGHIGGFSHNSGSQGHIQNFEPYRVCRRFFYLS